MVQTVSYIKPEARGKANLSEVVDRLLEGTHDDLIQEGHGLVT